jgi:hypothetical protein
MIKADLHSDWTLSVADGTVSPAIGDDPLPARVPGTVHTDLPVDPAAFLAPEVLRSADAPASTAEKH